MFGCLVLYYTGLVAASNVSLEGPAADINLHMMEPTRGNSRIQNFPSNKGVFNVCIVAIQVGVGHLHYVIPSKPKQIFPAKISQVGTM